MSTRTQSNTAFERGRKYFRRGQHAQAARQFQRWLKTHPTDVRAHHDLAATLMAMGLLDEAELACTAATQADPSYVQAWTSLASIQAARGQVGTPLKSMIRACRLAPSDANIRQKLGVMLLDHNHLDHALRTFELVHHTDAANLDGISGMGMSLERLGRLEDAYTLMAPHIAACVTHARMGLAWGAVCRRLGKPEQARPVLERMLADDALKTGGRMMMLFELGASLEKLGEPKAAWAAIEAANSLHPGQFSPRDCITKTDQIIATFTAELLADAPHAQDADPLPVLIVGMPRSGTSLVEQILAAHPDVSPAGELSDLQITAQLGAQAKHMNFPQWIPHIDTNLATTLGHWYLQRRRTSHAGALRVTDKMPQNFQMLGLAALLLPGASLIACERRPEDIAVSCFFQNFKAPLAWSQRLDWLRVYIDQQRRLMDHWDTVMPGRIHHVRYEDLVCDPEPHSRALIHAVGLPWHVDVREHHTKNRTIHTASYAQANQPIYRSSLNRSVPYSEFLAPHFGDMEDQ